jgi:hypothetical protein
MGAVRIGMAYTAHTSGRDLLCKHLRRARPYEQELQQAIEQGYFDHRGYQG